MFWENWMNKCYGFIGLVFVLMLLVVMVGDVKEFSMGIEGYVCMVVVDVGLLVYVGVVFF